MGWNTASMKDISSLITIVKPSFVVDTFQVAHVSNHHVVGLVHGHDGAHNLLGQTLTAWHTELVAKSPALAGVLIAATAALWYVVIHL
jgi:hypothetical protein